jgi:hypothetical protein
VKKILCRLTGHLPAGDIQRLAMSRVRLTRCERCGRLVSFGAG